MGVSLGQILLIFNADMGAYVHFPVRASGRFVKYTQFYVHTQKVEYVKRDFVCEGDTFFSISSSQTFLVVFFLRQLWVWKLTKSQQNDHLFCLYIWMVFELSNKVNFFGITNFFTLLQRYFFPPSHCYSLFQVKCPHLFL